MAQSAINGGLRIQAGTITVDRLASGFSLPTANLTDGASFLKRDGTVSLTADINFGGFKGVSVADPSAPQDAVNLRTAQSLINGLGVSKRARVIFTTNVALTGVQNGDGVTGAAGDIVYLNGQTTGAQNGLWQMNAGAWTRPTNWAAASTQKSFLLFIEEGTSFHDSKWTIIADAIVVDTTSFTALQDTSGATYTADTTQGIALTANAFSAKLLAASGLSFDGTGNIRLVANGSSLNLSTSGIKITDSGSNGQVMIGNASNVATFTTFSGDVSSITGAGVVTLATNVMKYSGFIVDEIPSGTINGTNPTFTLANTPRAGTLRVFSDGMRMRSGAGNDYTISGATITMLGTSIPFSALLVDYSI